MILKLQVDDSTWEEYARQAEKLQATSGDVASPESLMAAQLERFRRVRVTDRILVVDAATRGKLEAILSGGTLRDADDLLAKVEKLGSIHIGEVRLAFTPGQLAELANYAKRNSKTLDEVVRWTVGRMADQFFNHVG